MARGNMISPPISGVLTLQLVQGAHSVYCMLRGCLTFFKHGISCYIPQNPGGMSQFDDYGMYGEKLESDQKHNLE